MSRIRSIKPEFWVSEQVGNCTRDARLLFIGLWNFCDDQGVHPAKAKTLKAEVFPQDEDITSAKVADWVNELKAAGLVAEFRADGEDYWHVTGWSKHQRIDRPTHKHPAPRCEDSASTRVGVVEESSNAPRGLVEDSPSTPQPLAPGVEGIGVETIGDDGSSPAAPTAKRPTLPPCPFNDIVAMYHDKLPDLPRVKLMTSARKKAMAKRWEWVLKDPREDGKPRATTNAEALDWFSRFFTRAAYSDFLMGRTPRNTEHENWRCDIDFLLSDKGVKQVVEKTEVPA